jgi:hypothetical protein
MRKGLYINLGKTMHTTSKNTTISDTKVIIVCLLIAAAIFALDSLFPLGVAGGVPYILVVLLSLSARRKRLPVYMAVGVSLLTIAGFYSSPDGGELWKVLTNRLMALLAIWAVTVLSVQRRALFEEKEAALSEVKILSGFLPICASCKKIRDDQGYWQQLESYIRDHSEAEFSHGICPDCARRLYPDIDLYSEKKSD